jgi:hypothetical protein
MEEVGAYWLQQQHELHRSLEVDDLFIPNDADNSMDCAHHMGSERRYLLAMSGVLSMLSYGYLMWMYFVLQSPVFKRHPTSK